MAINKNHLFEDLEGVKCAVVESGLGEARKDFLKDLLEYNGYSVVVIAEPSKAPAGEGESTPPPTYKLGVIDVTFNVVNALYGRALRTRDGRVVTVAFWYQKEDVSHDEVPYYEA